MSIKSRCPVMRQRIPIGSSFCGQAFALNFPELRGNHDKVYNISVRIDTIWIFF